MQRQSSAFIIAALCTLSPFISSPLISSAETPPATEAAVRLAPDSRNQLMKFTDKGIEPAAITTRTSDSIVFFLNATSDALATLEIDYGGKRMHCASAALKLDDDGKIRSTRPFGPRAFASACFPDKGAYTVTVYGLRQAPQGLTGTVTVE